MSNSQFAFNLLREPIVNDVAWINKKAMVQLRYLESKNESSV